MSFTRRLWQRAAVADYQRMTVQRSIPTINPWEFFRRSESSLVSRDDHRGLLLVTFPGARCINPGDRNVREHIHRPISSLSLLALNARPRLRTRSRLEGDHVYHTASRYKTQREWRPSEALHREVLAKKSLDVKAIELWNLFSPRFSVGKLDN